jgi:hypothetical protein
MGLLYFTFIIRKKYLQLKGPTLTLIQVRRSAFNIALVKEINHSRNNKTKVAASIDFKPCSEAFESSKLLHVPEVKGFLGEVDHYCNNVTTLRTLRRCVQDR